MNAIKGVLVGFAATAVLFGGAAQAIAAPATSQSTEASAAVTGKVVAVVKGKSVKVQVDARRWTWPTTSRRPWSPVSSKSARPST